MMCRYLLPSVLRDPIVEVSLTLSVDCANQYFGERQCPACDQPLNDE